jgi:hypothetical protein
MRRTRSYIPPVAEGRITCRRQDGRTVKDSRGERERERRSYMYFSFKTERKASRLLKLKGMKRMLK